MRVDPCQLRGTLCNGLGQLQRGWVFMPQTGWKSSRDRTGVRNRGSTEPRGLPGWAPAHQQQRSTLWWQVRVRQSRGGVPQTLIFLLQPYTDPLQSGRRSQAPGAQS